MRDKRTMVIYLLGWLYNIHSTASRHVELARELQSNQQAMEAIQH